MNTIIQLVKAGYGLRKATKQCLKCPIDSPEYQLASYYDDHLKKIKDAELTQRHIETLAEQLREKQTHAFESEEMSQFLSSALAFLGALKPLIKH